jgi:hypothetical protein
MKLSLTQNVIQLFKFKRQVRKLELFEEPTTL